MIALNVLDISCYTSQSDLHLMFFSSTVLMTHY